MLYGLVGTTGRAVTSFFFQLVTNKSKQMWKYASCLLILTL